MSAYDAYRTARKLAENGRTDSDALTQADIDAAADLAGATRPTSSGDRHNVRLALDAIGGAR
ncbi:hypothetical protein [Streptomyces sp. NPDC048256]|uniref:hypothetical protein n=1 Tax=Streptomyces sp. NPDC048256 TaxID=3154613 RepID=UPI0033FD2E6D